MAEQINGVEIKLKNNITDISSPHSSDPELSDPECERSKATNNPWTPISLLSDPPINPLYDVIESKQYIQNLERKLEKIQRKKNGTVANAKDMIRSLQETRDAHMQRYMHENDNTNADISLPSDNAVDSNAIILSYLQRRLNPEKQALSNEELIALITQDEISKRQEEEEEMDEFRKQFEGDISAVVDRSLLSASTNKMKDERRTGEPSDSTPS